MPPDAPLHGIRIIECSALGPAAITMPLVDLGAEVIKVEPPAGDYIREMTWPIIEGVSLMHLHINRGKRSIVMDLRTEEDVATFKQLAANSYNRHEYWRRQWRFSNLYTYRKAAFWSQSGWFGS